MSIWLAKRARPVEHERLEKSSAEEWAETWERLIDLLPIDDDGVVASRDELLLFVLHGAADRCMAEAESRKPGIIEERTLAAVADARAAAE
jgi:hypothetical protein